MRLTPQLACWFASSFRVYGVQRCFTRLRSVHIPPISANSNSTTVVAIICFSAVLRVNGPDDKYHQAHQAKRREQQEPAQASAGSGRLWPFPLPAQRRPAGVSTISTRIVRILLSNTQYAFAWTLRRVENQPLLTARQQDTEHHTESSANADACPWVFAHVVIGFSRGLTVVSAITSPVSLR